MFKTAFICIYYLPFAIMMFEGYVLNKSCSILYCYCKISFRTISFKLSLLPWFSSPNLIFLKFYESQNAYGKITGFNLSNKVSRTKEPNLKCLGFYFFHFNEGTTIFSLTTTFPSFRWFF